MFGRPTGGLVRRGVIVIFLSLLQASATGFASWDLGGRGIFELPSRAPIQVGHLERSLPEGDVPVDDRTLGVLKNAVDRFFEARRMAGIRFRYPRPIRDGVLAALQAGWSPAELATELAIPLSTVRFWQKRSRMARLEDEVGALVRSGDERTEK
jgi:hypothetical protein